MMPFWLRKSSGLIKKIGVLGCGWLGFPLAKTLLSEGFKVRGTTTSEEKLEKLRKEGIAPFYARINENDIEGDIKPFLNDLDLLIINIPPKLKRPPFENYVQKIKTLQKAIEQSKLNNVLFVSSTAVYGENEGEITEETVPKPITESGNQLLWAEHILLENEFFKSTIIRFGGLINETRHPVTFLAGKKGLTNGNERINLIHQKDCVGLILKIIHSNYWNKVVNGVYPYHPIKHEYYTREAEKRGLLAPKYVKETLTNREKRIKSKNFLYKYQHSITTT